MRKRKNRDKQQINRPRPSQGSTIYLPSTYYLPTIYQGMAPEELVGLMLDHRLAAFSSGFFAGFLSHFLTETHDQGVPSRSDTPSLRHATARRLTQPAEKR